MEAGGPAAVKGAQIVTDSTVNTNVDPNAPTAEQLAQVGQQFDAILFAIGQGLISDQLDMDKDLDDLDGGGS